MNRTPVNKALSELSLEVFRLTARLNGLADKLGRPVGLSSARWQVLGTILNAEEQAISVAEIARRMGLKRQSVQRTADALATDGYLEYRPNPQHLRAKLAAITKAGIDSMTALHKLREQWANQINQQLELTELRQATATLSHLRSILDDED